MECLFPKVADVVINVVVVIDILDKCSEGLAFLRLLQSIFDWMTSGALCFCF